MAEQKQCRLCLQYFKQEEEVMKIPICEHILHPHCLRKWLIDFQKCPVCESNIIKLPGADEKSEQSVRDFGKSNRSAPGLRDFEELNQGRNVAIHGLVSPNS